MAHPGRVIPQRLGVHGLASVDDKRGDQYTMLGRKRRERMQCRKCHQKLSPAEVLRHEEQEREFEDFERELQQYRPAGLEDVEVPDHAPKDVDHITMLEDGTLAYPMTWLQPICDRCILVDHIETVLYQWDGRLAYLPMRAYADGTYGCPQNPVMAVSWGLVLLQWHIDDEDDGEDSELHDALQLTGYWLTRLTAAERNAARTLAEDVFAIARVHGAIWVPNPRPEIVAIYQRALGKK